MTAGGPRKGAGRKRKEPTKQVRIPLSGKKIARKLVDYYIEEAHIRLKQSTWYQNCPVEKRANIKLTFEKVEVREYAGGVFAQTAIAIAKDDTIGKELEIPIRVQW